MTSLLDFFSNSPTGCLWYIFVFVAGLLFPQVKLSELKRAFTGKE